MTKTFNKVLAVFLSIASLVFLAFVIAYCSGGINWQSELQAADLERYNFQLSDGEEPTWTVTAADAKGQDRQIVSGAKQLGAAILGARKDLDRDQKTKLQNINTELPLVTQDRDSVKGMIDTDEAAMTARIAQLEKMVRDVNDEVLTQSNTLTTKTRTTIKARTDASNRRKDVYRLTNELELLRTDRARLIDLRRELADELLRLQIMNQSLKQRVDQLQNGN